MESSTEVYEFLNTYLHYKNKKIIKLHNPDIVIAERTTSYGFLAVLCGVKPAIIAQQGITDLWPVHSILLPVKKNTRLCF